MRGALCHLQRGPFLYGSPASFGGLKYDSSRSRQGDSPVTTGDAHERLAWLESDEALGGSQHVKGGLKQRGAHSDFGGLLGGGSRKLEGRREAYGTRARGSEDSSTEARRHVRGDSSDAARCSSGGHVQHDTRAAGTGDLALLGARSLRSGGQASYGSQTFRRSLESTARGLRDGGQTPSRRAAILRVSLWQQRASLCGGVESHDALIR